MSPRFGLISTMAGDVLSPPSPLGDSLLGSPLCGDLMEDLRDISRSMGDDTLGFDFPEYQSTGSGSESSNALGEYGQRVSWLKEKEYIFFFFFLNVINKQPY